MYKCNTCGMECDGEASTVVHALDFGHAVFTQDDDEAYEPLDDPYF